MSPIRKMGADQFSSINIRGSDMRLRPKASLLVAAMMVATAAVSSEATFQIHIPAQPLKSALSELASQTGLQIVYEAELADHQRSPEVKGALTAQEALNRLLGGTGLGPKFINERAVAIAADRKPQASMGAAWARPPLMRIAQVTSTPSSEPSVVGRVSAAEMGSIIELKEVVVTGSRIRGTPPASPVLLVTQEDIHNAGLSDLGEVARSVLQNFNGGQNPGIAGGGNQGGQNNLNNSSAFNLRGFGPDATLTLINGHRVAYDAINQGVDVSAIPVAAVDRIEVMADGASALYGSDAVGGVVNVILKRDHEGLDVSAQLGATTDGGGERQRYSVVTGSRWESGGFMAALEYGETTEVTAGDRSYTNRQHSSQYLFPGQTQFSAVLAGHQALSDSIDFEWDANFADRKTETANAFSTTSDYLTNGTFGRPTVQSFSVTPRLTVKLPGEWEASLSGTYGESETLIPSRQFAQGVVSVVTDVSYLNKTDMVELGVEGGLFSLAAGDVRLAAGAGYRSAELDSAVTMTIGGVPNVLRDFVGSQDVHFGYGEVFVPLVGASNRFSLVEKLSLTAAVRHESYKDISDVTTPKLGLIYQPHRDVTMRLSWGKSFKVATLNQQNTPASGYVRPANAFIPGPPTGATVMVISGGNLKPLEPERATTWVATVGYQPESLEGLSLEASYFDVRYRDRVVAPVTGVTTSIGNPRFAEFIAFNPSAQAVLDIISGLPLGLSNQTGQPFNPATVGAIITNSLQNVSSENVHGVDVSAAYSMALRNSDRLQFNGSVSYLEADRRISDAQPSLERSGVIFTPPHWRGRISGTWVMPNASVSGAVNYTGGSRDNRFAAVRQIDSFTSFDVVARYRPQVDDGFLRGFEAGVSVLNLANEKPGRIFTTNPTDPPYDSLSYSALGRFVSVNFTKKIL